VSRVLVANRGVAAVRIASTLKRLELESVGLRSACEEGAEYFKVFDQVVDLHQEDCAQAYLGAEEIIQIAKDCRVEMIHPGWGFLSENVQFAEKVKEAGLKFIGPRPESIRDFGQKHIARGLAEAAGVPLLPGSGLIDETQSALDFCNRYGFPVIVKSTAGGGGVGMRVCHDISELDATIEQIRKVAATRFGNSGLFLERFMPDARHVEVQVFGDGLGDVIVLGDRDCSLQRRNQKVVEECPAPNIPLDVRELLHKSSKDLASSVNYQGAGTVEFLYDPVSKRPYFLEVNTRLQVEHGVTEQVFGIDLVEWMIQLTQDTLPPLDKLEKAINRNGHSIQVRLYAEDPYKEFLPSPGKLRSSFSNDGRVDSWLSGQNDISHWFDPHLANLISTAGSRNEAITQLSRMLVESSFFGTSTNYHYLKDALACEDFVKGLMTTKTLSNMDYSPREIEVLSSGIDTSVQSFPGRQGYWEVGVPPSGPMDDLSFRFGNRLLNNPPEAAGLEISVSGPSLNFRSSARVIVTGAQVELSLDNESVEQFVPFRVGSGQTLSIGKVTNGLRCYLLVEGGIEAAQFLGSCSTFSLAGFGGLSGKSLAVGNVLTFASQQTERSSANLRMDPPDLLQRHRVRVLAGPHTAPEFITEEGFRSLFTAEWRVDHNSSRTGVRLLGPKIEWARENGGEAGLHPSNIHDNAYAFGALDMTGDTPILLGPDGPSLGGFVSPAVVINADRWKLGQLCPGDRISLEAVSEEVARNLSDQQESWLLGVAGKAGMSNLVKGRNVLDSPVLWLKESETKIIVRRSGQEWLLVEFGEPVLDLSSRVAVERLVALIEQDNFLGIVEKTPGVRSLQIRFATKRWDARSLTRALEPLLLKAVEVKDAKVASRVVRMPLSWRDPCCHRAEERYMSVVNPDAPWCPDNLEFIRRINGLETAADVKSIVFNASYLVMGLGDVYLGAPVATPMDPTHRLVTTKYNPARTWTAQNSVGIGGAYMCVYGMEGPGGYQLVGRTTPVWRDKGFNSNNDLCWLLRHFDQIQFYEVEQGELLELRKQTLTGEYEPEIAETTFDLNAHLKMIEAKSDQIREFNRRRSRAFSEEMERWKELPEFEPTRSSSSSDLLSRDEVEGVQVKAEMSASVWKVVASPGTDIEIGETILVVEAMKAEFEIKATSAGKLQLYVKEGQVVQSGEILASIV
jgi:urea carboxylase